MGCRRSLQEAPFDIAYEWLPASGVGRARQHAVDRIRHGFVLFLDDDVRVSPHLLLEYEQRVRTNGTRAFYGGPVLIDYEEQPPAWLLPFLPPSVTGWNAEHSWPWFLGANFGAFAEDIRHIGGFNPNLGPGAPGNPTGDETDLQLRMAALGFRQIYVPEAIVWHYVEASCCTPEWALHRGYRNGVARALWQDDWYAGRTLVGGVPPWLYGKLMLSGAKLMIAALSGDRRQRFRRQREIRASLGHIHGARLRTRASSH
jgi:GT2 family glycosyltransferase